MTSEKKVILINTGTSASAELNRIGEGISSLTISNNGQVSTKQYVNQSFSTSKRTGLQKQIAFSGEYVAADKANKYLVDCSEKLDSNVETDLVIFMLKDDETAPKAGEYSGAKKYKVMVDCANDGSLEGGAELSIDGTIYVNGNPKTGTVTVAAGSGGALTYTFAETT